MAESNRPLRFLVSPGFTPETVTRTRTSPGPGSGSGNSPTRSTSAAGPFSSYQEASTVDLRGSRSRPADFAGTGELSSPSPPIPRSARRSRLTLRRIDKVGLAYGRRTGPRRRRRRSAREHQRSGASGAAGAHRRRAQHARKDRLVVPGPVGAHHLLRIGAGGAGHGAGDGRDLQHPAGARLWSNAARTRRTAGAWC